MLLVFFFFGFLLLVRCRVKGRLILHQSFCQICKIFLHVMMNIWLNQIFEASPFLPTRYMQLLYARYSGFRTVVGYLKDIKEDTINVTTLKLLGARLFKTNDLVRKLDVKFSYLLYVKTLPCLPKNGMSFEVQCKNC